MKRVVLPAVCARTHQIEVEYPPFLEAFRQVLESALPFVYWGTT